MSALGQQAHPVHQVEAVGNVDNETNKVFWERELRLLLNSMH